MSEHKKLGIKLRGFNRVCPITGYKEGSIKVGAPVVVQTDRGTEYGTIVEFRCGVPKALSRDVTLKKVIRYATAEDAAKAQGLPEREKKALAISMQKVKEHELPIRVVNVEYLFDTSRVLIYYKMADGKKIKNLRDITRDLSTSLEARVNLRQVSPRDQARLLGGLGPCGRSLCCSAWLEKPRHVTVKMAKEQGLQISPSKTSGACGRLMCCLEYEHYKNS
ncbi:MAG: regulatory iron-sulfur-containing complex subunit RicT [bacterium]